MEKTSSITKNLGNKQLKWYEYVKNADGEMAGMEAKRNKRARKTTPQIVWKDRPMWTLKTKPIETDQRRRNETVLIMQYQFLSNNKMFIVCR